MIRGRLRRRLAALALAGTGATASVLIGWTGSAHAQPPDVAGWWSVANRGDPFPAPPSPPDVKDGDLLVQGSNALPAGTPLGPPPAGAQAIAGVEFDLAAGDTVGSLTLAIDGTAPPQVSVVACRAQGSFTAASGGPWSQAPAYDGTSCVPGKRQGGNVVFDGVAGLVADGRLALVLLPGPLDRVVFKQPGDGTLAVTHPAGLGSAPPLGAGLGGASSGGGTSSGSATHPGIGAVAPAVPVPTSGGSVLAPTPDSGAPPVVAGGSAAATTEPDTRPVAATSGLSTGTRRALALAVIALEVLGYLWLSRSGADDGAAGPVIAGGRLRPPDRVRRRLGGGSADAGIGRFRRERSGAVPRL